MSVGTSLQSIRSVAGFSVAQLATKSRIPASLIADLERDDFTDRKSTRLNSSH